jgi:hypothetical protein
MGYTRRKKNLKKSRSKKRRNYKKQRYLRGGNILDENSMKKADNAAVLNNIKQVKKGTYLKLQ